MKKKSIPLYLTWRGVFALALSLIFLAGCAAQPNQSSRSTAGLTFATPESVGVDSERLERLTQAMQGFVD